MIDEQFFKNLYKTLEHLADQEVNTSGPVLFLNKPMYYVCQGYHYAVIGTRLIDLHRLNDERFLELFMRTNVDYAQFFKTRNAAKRAIAANRKGTQRSEKFNPHRTRINGYDCVRVVRMKKMLTEV